MWQTGEQIGHHCSVRYIVPEMELMSKYHTCLQNRQGLERWSPVAKETPATHIFINFPVANQKVVVDIRRIKLSPLQTLTCFFLFFRYKAERCTLKRNPLTVQAKKKVPPVTKEDRGRIKQWERSSFPLQGTKQPFITAPLSISVSSQLCDLCSASRAQFKYRKPV